MTMRAVDQHISAKGRMPHRARLRFERLPAAYCHPDHLAALLPDGLPAGFCAQLQHSVRLRHRLSLLLTRRFSLEPLAQNDLTTPEARFAQLEAADLAQALFLIGAILHARVIRKIILADPLRKLIERLGRDIYRAALRHIDLSPVDDDDQNDPADVDALLKRIDRDGLIAVRVWCQHQPAALAGRLKLKLPRCQKDDHVLSVSDPDHGQKIVDHVVRTFPPPFLNHRADDHG